ncbi:galactocerebrosidase-like isoform X2 [Gigantopelta aegis]|uniref:galactocerebrosidase-like isoform X2 n=1 Tax=Gigantopelta aegis TaxID=1735272 RepID=UPI001B88858A|nr:galactocerebrosidase-like isoform X2 [Gigantopelta aegis]
MMLTLSLIAFIAVVSGRTITYPIDDSVGLERRFDGIGGLSGGGATSKLLVNYPKKQRDEILDYLFKPNFGASLQILKVEIGGDSQSTDGTEASHMHEPWDENYQRGYEWWVMTEAKKRNPNIKLYGLPWAWPGWIGDGSPISPYKNVSMAASYIVKWILGAKQYHNLAIDYVGIWNERPYNIPYILMLRKMLDFHNLTSVRIVASDSGWAISDDILRDSQLASAVDIIGVHYPGTTTIASAMKTGKQLWSSEDYSTFNDNVGAGCWARILNQNYVNGFMTSTLSWNLIASYYNALPFAGDGLMTAIEPWSGFYSVRSPIWITAHTTQFTQIGWMYLRHGAGVGKLESGGSYVSLVSPDSKDLTIIIETMSHDHSVCIRPALPPYTVNATTIEIQLKGSFAKVKELYLWYSKLGFNGTQTSLFEQRKPVAVTNGLFKLSMGLDEVYTFTTLNVGQKGSYPSPPVSKPFPDYYFDDFNNYLEYQEPFNFAQQVGCFETRRTSDESHSYVMRQVVLNPTISWCPINLDFPITVMGDYHWSDIYVEAEMRLGPVNASDGVFLAARIDQGGCYTFKTKGIFFFIYPNKQIYVLANDLAQTQTIIKGNIPQVQKGWNKVSLLIEMGKVTGSINGQQIFKVDVPKKPKNGFVGLGTDSWGIADFDNFLIKNASSHQANNFNRNNILRFVPKHG